MPVQQRISSGEAFMLSLDDKPVGFLRSFEGGDVTADVVLDPRSEKKHLGNLRYEPIEMQFELAQAKALLDWINAILQKKSQPRSGSIITLDTNLKGVSELDFTGAQITEITFPKLDGASKEAAFMTVKMQPEIARLKRSSIVKAVPSKSKIKNWIASNFRLSIAGLDCSRVSKIDALTVKQTLMNDEVGVRREPVRTSGKIEFPNLRLWLSEGGAESWYAWHEDFVIQGNRDETHEKTGTLEILAPDLKAKLAQIKFFNLGIFKLAPEKAEANKETVRQVRAEMYCDRLELEVFTK